MVHEGVQENILVKGVSESCVEARYSLRYLVCYDN